MLSTRQCLVTTGSIIMPRGRGMSWVSWVEPAVNSSDIVPLATWNRPKWHQRHSLRNLWKIFSAYIGWDTGEGMSASAVSIIVHLANKFSEKIILSNLRHNVVQNMLSSPEIIKTWLNWLSDWSMQKDWTLISFGKGSIKKTMPF